ncbi:MAG TPA: hypothetical protein VJ256_03730 [Dehalococcoidia bacterium]|nr:hypothetical protein [Dehalococcoidia bacterium]
MKGRYAGVSMSINGAILPGAARLARLPAEPAFLQRVLTTFPFPVQAIQSDGGSEFLGEFGKAVETVGLVHYFNRPNYPQGNGRVERSFRTDEEEFYQVEELPGRPFDCAQGRLWPGWRLLSRLAARSTRGYAPTKPWATLHLNSLTKSGCTTNSPERRHCPISLGPRTTAG